MALIRIFANGIELDFINETLTLKQENNTFITDFTTTYSNYPFLIIENQKTKQALGPKDLASVRKKKVVPVVVLQAGQQYYGELTVSAYLSAYRKCDIKYGSTLLSVMSMKCGDLLPVVSIINDPTPVPFTEEYPETTPGYLDWATYPLDFNRKIYPEVKYGFPQMRWDNQFFDEAPEIGDEWYYYEKFVNRYNQNAEDFRHNYFIVTGDNVVVWNGNVAAPQLFLLGLLEYVFASQGWKITGAFVTDPFICRLMLLSQKNNLCKVMVGPSPETIHFDDFNNEGTLLGNRYYRKSVILDSAGTYVFSFAAAEPLRSGSYENSPVSFLLHGASNSPLFGDLSPVYQNFNDPGALGFQGTFTVEIDEAAAGNPYYFHYGIDDDNDSLLPALNIVFNREYKPFYMMHPTINLGRFAPDWDVATLLKQLKNTFALKIDFDELSKTAFFNYAQDELTSAYKVPIADALAFSEYTPPPYSGFVLKYSNDIDAYIYFDANGLQQNIDPESDLVQKIELGFKVVDHNGNTSALDTMEDKEGVGLLIYEPDTADGFTEPFISPQYNGRSTAITGTGGIYSRNWKKVMQARINGSVITVTGSFTGQELYNINKVQRVYMGRQAYLVRSTEAKQTLQDNFEVKIELVALIL